MTLYELTKKSGEGKGEGVMWEAVRVVSDAIDASMDEASKAALMRKVYQAMSDGHYNEEMARADVAKMYYVDANGKKHEAPYWPDDAIESLYRMYKNEIPAYNMWDFYVAMNMAASDNMCLLKHWFPNYSAPDMDEKIVELALNWLKDDDWPKKTKVWDYISVR